MIETRKINYSHGYDGEAEVYDAKRSFYETGYGGFRERKSLSPFIRGPNVLDLACGTGRLLPFLTGKGFEVVALDISRGMLEVAKNKTIGYKKINFIKADAEFLPFRENVFDEIVCSRAFKLFPNPLRALEEGGKILRKGGKSIITTETSEPLWIRIGYKLKIPYMGSRSEWRYRVRTIHFLLKKAGFKIYFTGCIIYFGKTLYQIAGKYFSPSLKLLELVDSHSRIGRNTLIVGIKD